MISRVVFSSNYISCILLVFFKIEWVEAICGAGATTSDSRTAGYCAPSCRGVYASHETAGRCFSSHRVYVTYAGGVCGKGDPVGGLDLTPTSPEATPLDTSKIGTWAQWKPLPRVGAVDLCCYHRSYSMRSVTVRCRFPSQTFSFQS